MLTNTAFVPHFPSSCTGPGISNLSRRNSLHFGQPSRKICWLTKNYPSQTPVRSRLSRQLLLRHKEGAHAESGEVKPMEQPDENAPVLRRTGMNSPMVLSREMQGFVGNDMMARSQVITHLGKYIKENGLYVEGNRRRFVVDQFLSRLLGVDGDHSMLALQKLVSKHLRHPREVGPEYEERSNRLFQTYLKERGAVDSKLVPRRRDPRGLNSLKTQKELREKGMGMYADVEIDPCLRPICGGRDRMSRPQLLKAVWTYIKSKNLQDPKNRRNVIVDDGLRKGLQITDAAVIDCFHVGRYLWKLCKDPRAM